MSLRRYSEKRDFTKTPEPKSGASAKLKSGAPAIRHSKTRSIPPSL